MIGSRGLAALAAFALLAASCGGATPLPIGGSNGSGSGTGGGGAGGGGAGGGSGGNPLVGTWADSMSSGGLTETATITLEAGGSVIESLAVTSFQGQSCSGSLQFTGLVWSSTATTITLSGTATCTGGVTCSGGQTMSCMGTSLPQPITCDYTLSNGDSTLVLTCPVGPSTTLVRQG